MCTINNSAFNYYLKTLKVSFSSGNTYLIDELGEVAVININDSTSEIKDVVTIDGYEFKLTESQKDELYAKAYNYGEEHIRQHAQYVLDCDDEMNLRIQSYRY